MSTHIPYPKIHGLHKDETLGILDGKCFIQEKLDGANLSVWADIASDGIYVGSRTQIVGTPTQTTGFRGAVEYCNTHQGIRSLVSENKTFRVFGEWLVHHSLNYPQECYNHFYMFDILDTMFDTWLTPLQVSMYAEQYGIRTPHTFAILDNPTVEDVKHWAGKSVLGGTTGEGVVIKNHSFVNNFGNRCYGKLVTDEFKEKNSIVFGNVDKHSPNYNETKFVTDFNNLPRLLKLINKIEQNDNVTIEKKHIAKLIGLMWYDIFTEELWNFIKKNHVNDFSFSKAESLCTERTKVLFFDWLENGKQI